MYLTYEDWAALGGDINATGETAFKRYEFKARKLIDRMTRGRVENDDPIRDAVKYCMYDLITFMHSEESISGTVAQQVSSMTNDGVSVTYATGDASRADIRYAAVVRGWLSNETTATGTPLLYAGVDA